MATQAQSGVIVTFWREDPAIPGTWEEYGETYNIDGPSVSAEIIDATHFGSGGYRDFITSFLDAGVMALSCNWTIDSYELAYADMLTHENRNYRITYALPAGDAKIEFAAKTSELTQAIPIGDKISATIGLRIDGALTITAP
jgi:hypothetical protein